MNIIKTACFSGLIITSATIQPLFSAQFEASTLTAPAPTEQVTISDQPSVQTTNEPTFSVLPDKLNMLENKLTANSRTHYYGFTALRGQKAILQGNFAPTVKLEIHEGNAWRELASAEKLVMPSLPQGQEIIVRFSARQDFSDADNLNYSLMLGSFPTVIRARLKDQSPGMARIPAGISSLGPLSSQGISNLTLEVDFADSTGKPLEGAMASLHIHLPESSQPKINQSFFSDSAGKIVATIDIGRCSGGNQVPEFIENNQGRNLWRTHYFEGYWMLFNTLTPLQGPHATHSDKGQLGHICHQRLIRSRP